VRRGWRPSRCRPGTHYSRPKARRPISPSKSAMRSRRCSLTRECARGWKR
jgi:hypothetical protein